MSEVAIAAPVARKVGRPAGVKNKKTPVAQRVRNVLTKHGTFYPTTKVKAKILAANAILPPTAQVKDGASLDVQIAQVRSKMIAEQTNGLVQPTKRGRRTKEQANAIQTLLAKVA